MELKISAYSLLELLIAMAVIAILAAISYSWYGNYLVTTRRANAELALIQLQSALENYYLEHKSYEGATLQKLHVNDENIATYYQLNVKLQQNGQSYEAQAIPIGAQAKDDKECGTLILATDGRRSYRSQNPNATCW